MPKNRDDASILVIYNTGRKIIAFVDGVSKNDLENDEMRLFAVLHGIQIMGEATKRLSPEFRAKYPAIPWKEIAGIRDRIVHQYDKINMEVIWDVVELEIPELLAKIMPLVPKKQKLD